MRHIQAYPAKLSVPRVQYATRRERLFRRMDGTAPIIWVTAPPGAGKTTLAASFAAPRKRPCLWYQIDGDDADPATFFHFMALATAKAAPRRRVALPPLTPEYLPDLPGFTRRFFRELFGHLPAGSLWVLDNYHELDGVPVFHELVRNALNELPDGLRVIVLSRTEPPPVLARLIANRRMHRIGWDDLRLTEEETAAIVGGMDIGAEGVRRLHEQSGGWAAGVILLLKYLESHGDLTAMPMQSRQSVFDYFAEEIFTTVPDTLRRFLVGTAFFPDFTVAMAQRIDAAADAILHDLCRAHCFIDRRDLGSETIHRYHDLFRDFLRAQVGDEAPVHRRATAQVLLDFDRGTEAIPLLLENGDWEAAVTPILAQAQSMIAQGRWQTLAGWIDALPKGMIDAVPWLTFWRGVAELAARPSAGRALMERAYEGFAAAGDILAQMLTASAIIEANYHEYADFWLLDQWREKMEALGAVEMDFPSVDVEMRVLTGMLSAIYMRQPASVLGQVLADRLEPLLERDIDPNLKSAATTFLLWFAIWGGDFIQARRIHAWADRLLAERRLTPLNDLMLRSIKGHGEIFLGDGSGAREVFDTAEDIGHRHGFASARIGIILPMQIYRHLMFGDLAAAEGLIAEAGKHPYLEPMNAAQIAFCRSWLALLRDNAPQACEHARDATGWAEKSGSYIARTCCHTAWAIGLIEHGDMASARRHLASAQQIMEGRRIGVVAFHLLLAEAWLSLREDNYPRCHDLLREALAQGMAQGYASTMQWVPAMMSELCAEALREGIEPVYARELIRKRGLSPPSLDEEHWPWPLDIRTLGGFAVLRDGEPIKFKGKVPKKPIALLKAIVALGGPDRGVPDHRLVDALWPDMEADAANEALSVTLHRLRKLLGDANAITMESGRVSLNPALCRVDAWSFDHLVPGVSERAATLYRGNFLPEDEDESWAISMRERLRMKFIQQVADRAKRHCERKECEHAIDLCQRGLDADDLIEPFHQNLMRCYHCLGRHAEGLAAYRRMKRTFSIVLGIAPSAESEALHRALLSQGMS